MLSLLVAVLLEEMREARQRHIVTGEIESLGGQTKVWLEEKKVPNVTGHYVLVVATKLDDIGMNQSSL